MIAALKTVLPVAALMFFAASFTSSGDVRAAGDSMIQRCEAEDGNALYTDKPCGQFQAHPARMSDDLTIRLAMAESAEIAATSTLSLGPYRDASEPLEAEPLQAPTPPPARRSPTAGCAHTPQQLSQDLKGAFALHDVNRVAESYHWVGMSHRQALPVMKRLERLSSRPLADARYLAAWIRSSAPDAGVTGSDDASSNAAIITSTRTDWGLMQLVFAGGDRAIDFSVRRYSGCYFIAS